MRPKTCGCAWVIGCCVSERNQSVVPVRDSYTCSSTSAILVLLLVTSLSLNPLGLSTPSSDSAVSQKPDHFCAYDNDDPILISSDSNFIDTALLRGWTGTGSVTDPIVIDGLSITCDGDCVSISDTSLHFVISGCLLTSPSSETGLGIYFNNVTNGRIERCHISQKASGVSLTDSPDCRIERNDIHRGLRLRYSDSCTISDNTFSGQTLEQVDMVSSNACILRNNEIEGASHDGLRCENSVSLVVSNNTTHNNLWCGIYLSGCHRTILDTNTAHTNGNALNGYPGVWVVGSENCTIIGNDLYENGGEGIQVTNLSYNSTITGNNVYGNAGWGLKLNSRICNISDNVFRDNGMGAMEVYSSHALVRGNLVSKHSDNAEGIKLSAFQSEVIGNTIENCSREGLLVTGSLSVIQNNTISHNGMTGLEVTNSLYVMISDNTIIGNGAGVSLGTGTYHCVIEKNVLIDNGVSLGQTRNATVRCNHISGGGDGVGLVETKNATIRWNHISGAESGVAAVSSSGFLISENEIYNCSDYGVRAWDCVNYSITRNEIAYSKVNGISILATYIAYGFSSVKILDNAIEYCGGSGIDVLTSKHKQQFTITNNCVLENRQYGFYLTGVEDGLVVNNSIIGNDYDGLYLIDSTNCTLYGNTLAWSGSPNSVFYNARDDGSDNTWDDGVDTGNAWSDYDGVGVYEIRGHAKSVDRYPSIVPDTYSPMIDHPVDIQYHEGQTGNVVTWTPYDALPNRYELYCNSALVQAAVWNGSQIVINVDGFTIGHYNFTLVVFDTTNNWISDTVMVTVLAGTTGVPTTTVSTTTTSMTQTVSTSTDVINRILQFLMSFEGIMAVALVVLIVVLVKKR